MKETEKIESLEFIDKMVGVENEDLPSNIQKHQLDKKEKYNSYEKSQLTYIELRILIREKIKRVLLFANQHNIDLTIFTHSNII